MKGVIALCIQDFKCLLTNALFWILTALLIIIIAVVNFTLPGDLLTDDYKIISFNINGGEIFGDIAKSEDSLRESVENGGSVGLIGSDDGSITILHPNLSEKTIHAIMLSIIGSEPYKIENESIYKNIEKTPFNKRMVPVFICLEALITGFILGGAIMLSEKENRIVKALSISPMGSDRYLISKALLFSILATMYALLITVFCIGFDFSWIGFLILSFFGSIIFTLIGLSFTTLFHDMSSWFFSLAIMLSINMLPVISYTSPSFSPLWMKLIPSYYMLFAYEKILFGGHSVLLETSLSIFVWCSAAYILGRFSINKYLKGAKDI